ncbi:hypothetical protein O3I_022140 [Nocardia brasiliensis ATCC 700358]|uniref:Uncharacterized protein n=1 Tax=Nocardia brasiliensis (strain ATCC 700358 / HUJEG-1) TaxID=1133849 RepID=K0ERF7_NOCB7|nr:hypothetical protein O3I_022140 [Nocardia brasiliensis ATCC 700358]
MTSARQGAESFVPVVADLRSDFAAEQVPCAGTKVIGRVAEGHFLCKGGVFGGCPVFTVGSAACRSRADGDLRRGVRRVW